MLDSAKLRPAVRGGPCQNVRRAPDDSSVVWSLYILKLREEHLVAPVVFAAGILCGACFSLPWNFVSRGDKSAEPS